MNRLVRTRSSCGQTRRPSRQGISGFTLTELLVTMAIMTLLLGLLLPAIVRAREKAKEAKLKHDFQTWYSILLMYTQDHDGSFPKVTDWAEPDKQVRKAFEPYLKDDMDDLSPITWRYGHDAKRSLNSVKLDQIRNPSRVPIGGERLSDLRGKQKVLVLFADGHVERLTPEELSELLTSDIVTGRTTVTVTPNLDGSIDIQL